MNSAVIWIAVVPMAFVMWYVAFFISMGVLSLIERLCPEEFMVSGMCTASWFPYVQKAVFCFGAALAAILIIVSVVLLAPAKKLVAAYTSLAIGIAAAFWLAVEIHSWIEFASATIAGVIAVLIVRMLAAQPGTSADAPSAASRLQDHG